MRLWTAVRYVDRIVLFFVLNSGLIFFFLILGNVQDFTARSQSFLLMSLNLASYGGLMCGFLRLCLLPWAPCRGGRLVSALIAVGGGGILFFIAHGLIVLTGFQG